MAFVGTEPERIHWDTYISKDVVYGIFFFAISVSIQCRLTGPVGGRGWGDTLGLFGYLRIWAISCN